MNAFLKTTRKAALAVFCLTALSLAAYADERTAGTMPVAKSNPASQEPSKSPDATETKKHKASPPVDLSAIESYGLLTNAADGGLGIDLWDGSDRDFLFLLINKMPAETGYRTTQDLLRRALLTRADVSFMTGKKKAEPGDDFLTLRIEKLSEMGAFAEAVKLYTANPDKPYHERLAQAGIMAMLYDGQTALACLEEKALKSDLPDVPFWQQLGGICNYFMTKNGGQPVEEKDEGAPFEDSKILKQSLKNKNFRLTLKSAADFEGLSLLEKVILASDGRLDYSGLNTTEISDFSALSSALILRDGNLPNALRLAFLTRQVRRGLNTPKAMTDFYESVSFAGLKKDPAPLASYKDIKDWKRLPYLYQIAAAAEAGNRPEIIANVLTLKDDFDIIAFVPFAAFLDDADAASLPAESVRTGIKIYALAGRKALAAWVERWNAVREQNTRDGMIVLAYDLATNFSTEIAKNDETENNEGFPEGDARTQLVYMIKEKLDKTKKFHKYTDQDVYEKNLDLTFGVGYVMPSVSLIDNLEQAVEDRRLGEVILLSAIALKEVPPEKMYAGLLRKVVYGFETVGLTKEAREIAMEVVLGIGNEKEN